MTDSSLVDRLERLERQNRRFKQCGLFAVIGLTAVLLMGQAGAGVAESIDVRSLRIVDASGNARLVLGMNDFGESSHPYLALLADDSVTPKAKIELDEYGDPHMAILKDGVIRAQMNFGPILEGPQFELNDSRGLFVARLRLDVYDDPSSLSD